MPPSRLRLQDAAVVVAFLALLSIAGRLNGASLQSGEPAAADRSPPSLTAAQAPPRAVPRTLPVVARILLPGRSGLLQGGLGDERAVAAASGAVWVADGCAVARVHPPTNQMTGRVVIGERGRRDDACRVLGLTISPDTSVWVATTTVLVRIDRAGRRVAATLPLAPSGAPAADSGAIWVPCCWVASAHGSLPLTGWLLRVDPATDRVTARIPLAGGHPKAVGAGDGGIWVAGYRDRQDRPGEVTEHAPVLWRVDPATNQVVRSFSPPGSPAALLASDPSPPSVLASHGAVFMSDPSSGVVWQVDPDQHRFIGSLAISQGGPLAAAAGVVWAGRANSLVPLTGPNPGGEGPRLLDPLGRWITGLAASPDTLWVATSDALFRIDPHKLDAPTKPGPITGRPRILNREAP
jgi:hypothetical protein